MMVRLEWSPYAIEDRESIFDHIAQDNPLAAVNVDDRIREQTEQLIRHPQMGRPGRAIGTRELVISHTPYVVAYRILGDDLRILRVLHSAQRWPESIQFDAIA